METLTFKPGQCILKKDAPVNGIFLISAGSVVGSCPKGNLFLGKGDCLAVFDIFSGYSFYDYVASDATVILKYPLENAASLLGLIRTTPDLNAIVAATSTKICCSIIDDSILQTYNCNQFYNGIIEYYRNYIELCKQSGITAKTIPEIDEMQPLGNSDLLPDYLSGYYDAIRSLSSDVRNALFRDNPDFTYGYLQKTEKDIHNILEYLEYLANYQADYAYLLLNPNGNDLFDLYTSLCVALERRKQDTISINALLSKLMIQMEGQTSIDRNLYQARIADYRLRMEQAQAAPAEDITSASSSETIAALNNSAAVILEYSDYPEYKRDDFISTLNAYKSLPDRASTDDRAISLRKKLTPAFYEIYENAFQYSLRDKNVPLAVKLFLLFGFIDEELAGHDNTSDMMDMCDSLFSFENAHIYTFYSWLKAIYVGKKEPSRNEFDTDYTQYLHELKVSGKISTELEHKMLRDPAGRVKYELQGLFPPANKITSGRISTFCPFFSEHNCLHKPSESLVTADKIRQALSFVISVDFRAFCRDNLFTMPEAGINHENFQLEICPDFILMPCTGSRGALWQEIEGRKRTTPARMLLPVLCQEDTTAMITRLTGEYRWEMCKRVQSSRWNDVSDPSLTSEYFDYIQFYRKNNDLSPDAKEKIKTGLARAKNSYKEMFVRDYIQWIYFEGTGSPRLNKVVRKIMFKYCPFSHSIREKLAVNPMYKEVLDYFNLHNGQAIHRIELLMHKIQSSGHAVPDAVTAEMKLLRS